MKKQFLAILIGSLFSCPLYPTGIFDEPGILYDAVEHRIDIHYVAILLKKKQYLVNLLWQSVDGKTYRQTGRLARKRRYFRRQERERLEVLQDYSNQNFYFYPTDLPQNNNANHAGSKRKYSQDDDIEEESETAVITKRLKSAKRPPFIIPGSIFNNKWIDDVVDEIDEDKLIDIGNYHEEERYPWQEMDFPAIFPFL